MQERARNHNIHNILLSDESSTPPNQLLLIHRVIVPDTLCMLQVISPFSIASDSYQYSVDFIPCVLLSEQRELQTLSCYIPAHNENFEFSALTTI